MNCNEARHHWNLYHDSEGDPELYTQINEHLGKCPECAEWFHEQSRLEEELSERLVAGEATVEIWERVVKQNKLQKPSTIRRWFLFSSIFAMAVSLLVALFAGWPDAVSADGGGAVGASNSTGQQPPPEQHGWLVGGYRMLLLGLLRWKWPVVGV